MDASLLFLTRRQQRQRRQQPRQPRAGQAPRYEEFMASEERAWNKITMKISRSWTTFSFPEELFSGFNAMRSDGSRARAHARTHAELCSGLFNEKDQSLEASFFPLHTFAHMKRIGGDAAAAAEGGLFLQGLFLQGLFFKASFYHPVSS